MFALIVLISSFESLTKLQIDNLFFSVLCITPTRGIETLPLDSALSRVGCHLCDIHLPAIYKVN